MTTKDGGPAFPVPITDDKNSGAFAGMSLRDWFAGQALIGVLQSEDNNDFTWIEYAEAAYQLADRMLAERVRQQPRGDE